MSMSTSVLLVSYVVLLLRSVDSSSPVIPVVRRRGFRRRSPHQAVEEPGKVQPSFDMSRFQLEQLLISSHRIAGVRTSS
jgi:hypothetical protein